MALAIVKSYRPAAERQVLTAATYSELFGTTAAATIRSGDEIRVLSSGLRYVCTGPESYERAPSIPGEARYTSCFTDFRDGVGIAVSSTATNFTIPGSGVVVCGQGLAETDAGVTVAFGAGGAVASLLTTDEAAHVTALALGGATEPWTPATHGPMTIEAEVAMDTALTDRAFFIGFVGAYADALDPVATGATTTITLVQDNLSGLFYDSGLTAATRLYAAHNKADEAASHATTATGVDTGVNFSAAGTYMKLKVVIHASGKMTCYINDAIVTEILASAATDVALVPVVYVESNAAAIKTMLVKSFAAYAEG